MPVEGKIAYECKARMGLSLIHIWLGLAQGDRVMLETSVGGIEGWVDITENVLPGTIFTPSNCNATTPLPENRSEHISSIGLLYTSRCV